MLEFINNIEDDKIKFVVIIARNEDGNWIICKHKERNSYEFPGGHREKNETIIETAKRELYEETGAIEYNIKKIGIYKENIERYGALFEAEISRFTDIPNNSEIEKIEKTKDLNSYIWTYPAIQKNFLEYIINDKINKLKDYIKEFTLNEGTGHDWWHIERVYNIALHIAKKENARVTIIKIISLIHDLYDHKFFDGEPQKEIKKVLEKFELTKLLSTDEIENILYSCLNLGYSSNIENKKELSVEGRIVQDADRLDAIGAIGIARTFAYGGSVNRNIYNPDVGIIEIKNKTEYNKLDRHSINHFYEKLLKLKDLMNTDEAKRIATLRHKFMLEYLEEFFGEWKGEK